MQYVRRILRKKPGKWLYKQSYTAPDKTKYLITAEQRLRFSWLRVAEAINWTIHDTTYASQTSSGHVRDQALVIMCNVRVAEADCLVVTVETATFIGCMHSRGEGDGDQQVTQTTNSGSDYLSGNVYRRGGFLQLERQS